MRKKILKCATGADVGAAQDAAGASDLLSLLGLGNVQGPLPQG